MEYFILSQTKMKLVPVNRLLSLSHIYKSEEVEIRYDNRAGEDDIDTTLGTYKNIGRAKEVLEEICQFIAKGISKVYYMPQE